MEIETDVQVEATETEAPQGNGENHPLYQKYAAQKAQENPDLDYASHDYGDLQIPEEAALADGEFSHKGLKHPNEIMKYHPHFAKHFANMKALASRENARAVKAEKELAALREQRKQEQDATYSSIRALRDEVDPNLDYYDADGWKTLAAQEAEITTKKALAPLTKEIERQRQAERQAQTQQFIDTHPELKDPSEGGDQAFFDLFVEIGKQTGLTNLDQLYVLTKHQYQPAQEVFDRKVESKNKTFEKREALTSTGHRGKARPAQMEERMNIKDPQAMRKRYQQLMEGK